MVRSALAARGRGETDQKRDLGKILIVDDEASIRELISIALEPLGHDIIVASDGDEAVQMVTEHSPDLVVLDVMVPKMDGWAVMRQLRVIGLKSHTRVLMLTAKSGENDFLDGWNLGVDEYMTKPFDPDDLVEAAALTLRLSVAEIRARRLVELEKANLLSRVESAFGEGPL